MSPNGGGRSECSISVHAERYGTGDRGPVGVIVVIFDFFGGSKACVTILPLLTCYRITGPLRGVEPLI